MKKQSPYAFIIVLMLIISSAFPSLVSANSDTSLLWEKEFDGSYHNEITTTSTNEILMGTYEINYGANYELVYTYDFMKLDYAGNILEKKEFKNGTAKVFEYQGHSYIAFVNHSNKRFELYNEKFELLSSKSMPFQNESYSILIKDDIIAVNTGVFWRGDVKAVYYSLKTFDEIPSSQIPIDRYVGDDKNNYETDEDQYSIYGLTFADTIVEEVPIDFESFTNGGPALYSPNVSKYNGYFYAAVDVWYEGESENSRYNVCLELFKIDLQGTVVDSVRTRCTMSSTGDYESLIFDDKIIVYSDKVYSEYSFDSLSLTKTIDSSFKDNFGYLDTWILGYLDTWIVIRIIMK